MNSPLVVDDPLANQAVTIIITLSAGEQPRAERSVLISLGVTPAADSGQAETLPVIKTGIFGAMPALIDEAWTSFGLQAQMAETVTASETAVAGQIVATADTLADEPAPAPPPNLMPVKPQAKNLSLF